MTALAWTLLAVATGFAAGNWVAVGRGIRGLEYVCKPATMVALIGVAVALDPHDGTVRAWFVAALVLSLAGDVFLMLPSDRFVAGLASFLLAHVAYVVGLVLDGVTLGALAVGVVVVLAAMGAVGVRIVRAVRAGPDPALGPPVLAYMVVISTMVAVAVGTGRPLAAAGAALFYASDAMIAWNRFVAAFPGARVAIMVTYHLGQAGLVLSLVG